MASEVHRQVRAYAQSVIKPGIKLSDMCELIEETNRRLVKENGLQVMCYHHFLYFTITVKLILCFVILRYLDIADGRQELASPQVAQSITWRHTIHPIPVITLCCSMVM